MSAPISAEDFRTVMSRFASGVTIVTTVDEEGKRWGITVSAFCSLSLDPPLCLVCIDRRAGSLETFRQTHQFAVNVLTEQQTELSNRFASRIDDKFEGIAWDRGPATGSPVFPDALAWMDCEVRDILSGGDHDIFVGELHAMNVTDGKPLLYYDGAYAALTNRPKSW